MQGMAVAKLINLLPATESVGDNDCGGWRGVHRRQESQIRNGFGNFDLVGFKAERTRHTATGGVDELDRGPRLAQQRDLVHRPAEHRLVVAVTVKKHLRALQPPGNPLWRLCRQPVGKKPDLAAHFPGQFGETPILEKVQSFILEDAGATRLKEDERQSGFDLRSDAFEDLGEIALGVLEQAEVVKRATATDVALGGLYPEAGLGKEFAAAWGRGGED